MSTTAACDILFEAVVGQPRPVSDLAKNRWGGAQMVLRYSNVRKEFKQELSLARDWNQLPPVYDTGESNQTTADETNRNRTEP